MAARIGEENTNRSKERWRERTRRTRIGKREEKEKKGKRTNTWKPEWSIRGRSAHGLQHPGGGGPGLENRGKSGPGLECPGQQKEEEATAARSGRENMIDGERTRITGSGGGHAAQRPPRTGTTGWSGQECPGKKQHWNGASGTAEGGGSGGGGEKRQRRHEREHGSQGMEQPGWKGERPRQRSIRGG